MHSCHIPSRSFTFSSLFPTADKARSLFAPLMGASDVRKLLSKTRTRQLGTTAEKSVGKVVKRQPDSSSRVRLKKCSLEKASGNGLSVSSKPQLRFLTCKKRNGTSLQLKYSRRMSRRSFTGKSLLAEPQLAESRESHCHFTETYIDPCLCSRKLRFSSLRNLLVPDRLVILL